MNPMDEDRFLLRITRQTHVAAPVEVTFESILGFLGGGMTLPDGKPFPMVLEAHPGGRWYRDLGENAGHLWGHVQVIKPPALLELVGPMFMSYAVASHVQYRVEKHADGSLLSVRHEAIGDIRPEHRQGVSAGWDGMLQAIARRASVAHLSKGVFQ